VLVIGNHHHRHVLQHLAQALLALAQGFLGLPALLDLGQQPAVGLGQLGGALLDALLELVMGGL